MNRKNGFTLVEVVLSVAIVVMIAVTLVGSLNPIKLQGKGLDARRKQDLGRIAMAMEEYYNDKKCYPSGSVVTNLNNVSSCNKKNSDFSTKENWPCDPVKRLPYYYVFDPNHGSCPTWYRVLTKLDNPSDADIPVEWGQSYFQVPNSGYSYPTVNYGVSSSNVIWYR